MKLERIVRGNYVQGHFQKIKDAHGELPSRNPGDLEQQVVPFPFSYEHVGEAASAARRAFSSWRRMPPSERAAAVSRYRDFLAKRAEEVAFALCWELGIPLWDTRAEVKETLTLLDYYLSLASQNHEVKISADGETGTVRFMARGTMAVIAPPVQTILLSHLQMVPALLYGNTVTLKVSELSPYTGQLIAEIVHDSGLPPGVVNILQGDYEVTRRLSCLHDTDGVLFTGSYETGTKLYKQLAGDPSKLVVLDLGGKNGTVVWDDCDYKKALTETLYAAFVTSGQRQGAADRILVHAKIFDKFAADFHAAAKKCKVGYGALEGDKAPFMGPLVSEEVLEDYLRSQGMAVRDGSEEIMRGKALERDKRGYYVSPSIHWVQKADPKSTYQKTEICGPNVALFKVSDLEEASDVLNHSPFGQVATIYTKERANFHRLIEDVPVGQLHWNRPTTALSFRMPYGGVKKSGNARPMGSFALHQCTYPVSSLEEDGQKNAETSPAFPAGMPKWEIS